MAALLPDASTTLVFFVNGKKVTEAAVDPTWTLLWFLRHKLRLVGSKLGCGEGGCGACTVMVSRAEEHGIIHYAVNACLAPLTSVHGAAVTTVEGLGSATTRLHPLQERLARAHASQCGFCTPGFVMSAYALLRSQSQPPSMQQMEEALVGNLCRCTGYRPIIEGLRGFTADGCGKVDCCKNNASTACDGPAEGLEVTGIMFDPGEFAPYDPTQELIFPPELKMQPELAYQQLVFKGPRVTFYQVTALEQLLNIKHHHPEAKIVIGNTEVGVEVALKKQYYPVLVSVRGVREMEAVVLEEDGLLVGAAVTLTTLEDQLKLIIASSPTYKTRVFVAMVEMLRWFAGKQIRNVACLGGNVMTGSPISDLIPVLMAAQATLFFQRHAGAPRAVPLDGSFFTGYRRNVAAPDEVLVAIKIPYTGEDEYFEAFKQARRRDDDIAIVNASFRVVLVPGTTEVKAASLCFGGVAATIVHAKATSKLMEGLMWSQEDFVDRVTSSLVAEVTVPPSAPGGMVVFRRTLVPSFFFKFYLHVREHLNQKLPGHIEPLTVDEKELIQPYTRPPPKSMQFFQKVSADQAPIDPIGRPVMHVSAVQQLTGEAVYVDDLPEYTNELFAAVVLTTKARASIASIDPSEALALDGVHSFVSAKDLPDERNKNAGVMLDEEVFVSVDVACVGQVIGLVLAACRHTAKRAADLVKVVYEHIHKPIITIEEAIAAESWYPPKSIWTGDVATALSAARYTLQGEIRIGGQEHFYLETNAHLAVPQECGGMDILSTSQNPMDTQKRVAAALGVPLNRVVCRVKRMGGGFGGKETRTTALSVPAAVAAAITGRPVRLVLDRDEDMLVTGTRHPFLGRWKTGFSSSGKLEAMEVDLYSNAGCSMDLSVGVMDRALFSVDNAYKCANVRVTGYICRTNLPSNTAFRGFGGPQAMMVAEDVITNIAEFLDKDPMEVRRINLYKDGDEVHFRQVLEDCSVRKCFNQVIQQARYLERKALIENYNKTHKYRKKGIAVVPTKYAIAFTARVLNQAAALVLVYTDGSVLLSHGGTEMGQGLHTKMIQIASRVLELPMDRIHISETSTDKVPNASPTAASFSSDINGEATLRACNVLKERLEPYKQRRPEAGWNAWVLDAYNDRVPLSATGFYATPDLTGFDFEKQEGRVFNYFSYGAAVSEVEVDRLSGDHTVLRTDIVMDVGDSLNPAVDVGQIEGGFVQGLGLFTLEELRYTPEGALLTRGPGAYKLPGIADIPCEMNVTLLRDAPNMHAVYSSKAVGEPPLFLAASVFHAIRAAVLAARKDNITDSTISGTAGTAGTADSVGSADSGTAGTGSGSADNTVGSSSSADSDNDYAGGADHADTDSAGSSSADNAGSNGVDSAGNATTGSGDSGDGSAGSAGSGKASKKILRLDSPATAERIRLACEDVFTRKIPVAKEGTFRPWDVTV